MNLNQFLYFKTSSGYEVFLNGFAIMLITLFVMIWTAIQFNNLKTKRNSYHIMLSIIMTVIFLKLTIIFGIPLWCAGLGSMLIGTLKELNDKRLYHAFSWMDIFNDFVGTVYVLILYCIIKG